MQQCMAKYPTLYGGDDDPDVTALADRDATTAQSDRDVAATASADDPARN